MCLSFQLKGNISHHGLYVGLFFQFVTLSLYVGLGQVDMSLSSSCRGCLRRTVFSLSLTQHPDNWVQHHLALCLGCRSQKTISCDLPPLHDLYLQDPALYRGNNGLSVFNHLVLYLHQWSHCTSNRGLHL